MLEITPRFLSRPARKYTGFNVVAELSKIRKSGSSCAENRTRDLQNSNEIGEPLDQDLRFAVQTAQVFRRNANEALPRRRQTIFNLNGQNWVRWLMKKHILQYRPQGRWDRKTEWVVAGLTDGTVKWRRKRQKVLFTWATFLDRWCPWCSSPAYGRNWSESRMQQRSIVTAISKHN
jgi:hypothetical protein